MEHVLHKKFSFNSSDLLIDHIIDVKFCSDNHLSKKLEKDEDEQKIINFISDKEKFKIKPYYNQIEVIDFLSSKLRAMGKMDLDDECFEGKVEIRKIDIDKNVFPKSKNLKNKKGSTSPKNKYSGEKPKNKTINKNVKINANGKIKKTNIKSIGLLSDLNFEINNEIKEQELNDFFSNKTLLVSIINEMK